MESIKKYKYFIIVLLISIGFNVYLCMREPVKEEVEEVVLEEKEEEVYEEVKEYSVVVDIKGAVKKAGVYELPNGSRVINALELCGGVLDDADTSSVNLSKKLTDEMIISIPYKREENVSKEVEIKDSKISINKASEEELMTLTGIGKSKAQAIIEYRKSNPFEKIEDIINVNGISESVYEKIKEDITI